MADFQELTQLGKSMERLKYSPPITLKLSSENTLGLPEIYNRAIDDETGADIVVFIHDDVWIDDFFIGQRIIDALKIADVVGVAGNRRRWAGQSAWPHSSTGFDNGYISGRVGQVWNGLHQVTDFGPVPAHCELLDGVLLAARKSRLREVAVRFDERFDFHFYDLDFCRTARAAGLRLATWPMAITHHNNSAFGTPDWLQQKELYFQKWGT